MRRLRLLMLVMLLISVGDVFTQQSDVEFSLHKFEIEGKKRRFIGYAKDEAGNYILLIGLRTKIMGGVNQLYLETRDSDFNVISSKNITSDFQMSEYVFGKLNIIGNKLLLTSSKYNKQKNNEVFYVQTLDLNSLELSERKSFYAISYGATKVAPSISIKISPNDDSFLLTIKSPYKNEYQEQLTLVVFDSNLKYIWEKSNFHLHNFESTYYIKDVILDANQVVYVLGRINDGVGSKYKMFRFSKDSESQKTITINDDKTIKLMTNKQGVVFYTGYFTTKATEGLKGSFIKVFNPETMDVVRTIESDFSDENLLLEYNPKVREKILNSSIKNGKEIGTRNLLINHLVNDKNGNFYLIGSEFEKIVHTSTDAKGATTNSYTYDYGDIYISKFSPDLKEIYNSIIPKNTVYNAVKIPYTFVVKGDEISFIFDDNKENAIAGNIDKNGVKSINTKTDNIGVTTLSENGAMKRSTLFDYKAEGYKRINVIDKDIELQKNSSIFSITMKKVLYFALIK